jgi:multidrug efflux pump subunit AcrB
MNVSTWCIKNPVPAIMFFILLTLTGVWSFMSMKVQNFPDLELPTISIVATLPGAAPAQMESEVARKIENAIATVQGIKHIYTKVSDGGATITAEFRLEKSTQEALDEVRSAVASVRADLPADVRDPIVNKLNLSGSPVLAFSVNSKRTDPEALSWFVDDELTKRMLGVKGVGQVTRVGGVTRQVQVLLDPARMQSLGATAADVSRQLRGMQVDAAGGRTDVGGSEQPVRIIANVDNAHALSQMEISLQSGQRVRLDQIATVVDTVAEPRAEALLNGIPVVGFEISRSKGASEIEVGKGVYRVLDELKVKHPDMEFAEAFNFVEPVQEEFDASMTLLIEGALLAVLVVFLFLRDLRATFVSAVALPLSVIPAFIGMHYLGFTLNVVTLLALSLVIGILVDDAIVEVENIVRHLRMGKTPMQAATEAADEIGLAVIATTFTLIAVFLPTAFMSGIPGKFFKQFGWTASLAVFASLVVARMLTPMMAAYMLKPIVDEHRDPKWLTIYMKWAAWCTKHRWITSFAAAAFFVGSIFLVSFLKTGFIPPDDNSQTQVRIELPPGSTLGETKVVAERARVLVAGVKYVKSIYTTIGAGSAGGDPFAPPGTSETRKATLTIILAPRGERTLRKQPIEAQIRQAIEVLPGVRTSVGLGASGDKYQLVLTGDDSAALTSAALAIERDLRTIPGIGGIASSASLVRPEIMVRPDSAKAADLGVSSTSIAEALRVATVGDYDQSLPKLNLSQRQVPVLVQLDPAARKDLSQIERLLLPSNTPGKPPVMLGSVATIEIGSGPAIIDRYDRARNITFDVELSGQPLGEVTEAVKKLPSVAGLPAGVKVIEIGDAEIMVEFFLSFLLAMGAGILCIYIVLVLLFKDVLHPITILMALPLSFGGAFVGLLLANKLLSMPSGIGIIMLMGVATKNSILLVEYAIVARRDHGMSLMDALMDACHKRARPIIMTTIAMGAGMLPIAIGIGSADPSFRSPMAVAVIGGLVTSTILSLLVIPPVFTIMDDLERLLKRGWTAMTGLFSRGRRAKEQPASPNAAE